MSRPPKWLHWLLRQCAPASRPDLEGDFLEIYADQVATDNKILTQLKWVFTCLTLLPLKILIPKEKQMKHNWTQILALYLKIGRRTLVKNKLYAFINLSGLAVGLAACILITYYVRDELSYDKHFPQHESLYRLSASYDNGGDARTDAAMTSWMIKPMLEDQFGDIDLITRADFNSNLVTVGEQQYPEEGVTYADSIFFEVFRMEFQKGSPVALQDPSNVILTEHIAQKYFGDEEPIGQIIELNDKQFKVAAVTRDLPANTHFEANIFLPMHGVLEWYSDWVTSDISGYSVYTYIKSARATNPQLLTNQINALIEENWPGNHPPQYFLQPVTDIHLYSDLNYEAGENGSIHIIYIFGASAFIILLLACMNYVNLSLAGSFQRSKEVGMKKVLGATRRSQVIQFQLESLIMMVMGALLAILLVALLAPLFHQLTDKTIRFDMAQDYPFVLILLGMLLLTGLLTGSFPAIFLLRIPALAGLRGRLTRSQSSRFSVRNIMVTAQFFISVTLIVSSLAITNQLQFLRNKDLGVNPDNMLMVSLQTPDMSARYELFRELLLRNPAIEAVAASTAKMTNRVGSWRSYKAAGSEDGVNCPTAVISHGFFETVGAEILQGRAFDKAYPSDAMQAYVLNESAVEFFELTDPIGSSLTGRAFTGSQWATKDAKIIGVVKDFHFASLHDPVRPVVFSLSSEQTMRPFWAEVRAAPGQLATAINVLEQTWNELSPERPFYFELMEDELAAHYEKEDTFLQVFSTFSFLAIFIGCLGLFGITAIVMQWRTREIGIRKVLGARFHSLILLLSREFIWLIAIANLLGWPLAYYFISEWIKNFAYQAPISLWLFAAAGFGLLAVGFLTVFYHTWKAARSNPVESIKASE